MTSVERLIAAGKKLLSLPHLLLAAAAVVGFIFWAAERDARLRQAGELRAMKNQAGAEISALRSQADADLEEANHRRAEAVRRLEIEQQRNSRLAEELRAQLASLQAKENARLAQTAALPPSELASRVAARLDLAPPGKDQARQPTGSAPSALLALDEPALRKAAAAFVELDSCREREALEGRQAANCRDQVATGRAEIEEQKASIEKLNQALAARAQAEARRVAELEAELRAARGTRLGRLGRSLEKVLLGVAIGMVVR